MPVKEKRYRVPKWSAIGQGRPGSPSPHSLPGTVLLSQDTSWGTCTRIYSCGFPCSQLLQLKLLRRVKNNHHGYYATSARDPWEPPPPKQCLGGHTGFAAAHTGATPRAARKASLTASTGGPGRAHGLWVQWAGPEMLLGDRGGAFRCLCDSVCCPHPLTKRHTSPAPSPSWVFTPPL